MKNSVLLAGLIILFTTPLLAQDPPSDIHQQTTPPANARFEIVQSELLARLTFRLDRFTGRVAQLVRTDDDGSAWEDTEVKGLPSLAQPARARFQLFTSGLAARHTFLIDTENGKTWIVVTRKVKRADGTVYDLSLWEPFPE